MLTTEREIKKRERYSDRVAKKATKRVWKRMEKETAEKNPRGARVKRLRQRQNMEDERTGETKGDREKRSRAEGVVMRGLACITLLYCKSTCVYCTHL